MSVKTEWHSVSAELGPGVSAYALTVKRFQQKMLSTLCTDMPNASGAVDDWLKFATENN